MYGKHGPLDTPQVVSGGWSKNLLCTSHTRRESIVHKPGNRSNPRLQSVKTRQTNGLETCLSQQYLTNCIEKIDRYIDYRIREIQPPNATVQTPATTTYM